MYRIIMVDDELDVLEYFKRIILEQLSDHLDLDMVTFDSGKKVLEYIQESKVDIIISDIQMPEMDGMELYHRIRKIWPKVGIIFLTGFLEFDYVYESARDVHARFLTKLEPIEKILTTIETVIDEIAKSYQDVKLIEEAKEQSRLALPILQNEVIKKLLLGSYDNEETLRKSLNSAKIEIDLERKMILFGIIMDGTEQELLRNEIDFLQESITNKYLSNQYDTYHYYTEKVNILSTWILQKKEGENRKLPEMIEYVQNVFRETTGLTISCAYTEYETSYEELPLLYKRLHTILGYHDLDMTECIIPFHLVTDKYNLLNIDKNIEKIWSKLERLTELEGYLELGKEDEFEKLLDELTKELKQVRSMNDTMALEIYFKIAVMLLTYINFWQLNEKIAFRIEPFRLLHIEMHENWKDAVCFLKELSRIMFELYFDEERNGVVNYITILKNYIKENIDKELTLVLLADHLHLNASYLSRLFKKLTGIKLFDYILELRMSRATELILKSNMKIQEISTSVGYESVQSFNRAFKKYTGNAPLEYRNGVNRS